MVSSTVGGIESTQSRWCRLLQEFQAKGGRLTLPVGCYGIEDWLLDAVDVPSLLQLLQTGKASRNAGKICSGARELDRENA